MQPLAMAVSATVLRPGASECRITLLRTEGTEILVRSAVQQTHMVEPKEAL